MEFLGVLTIAVIIEGFTEYAKSAIPFLQEEGNSWIIFLITLVLGILSAVLLGADIFAILGTESEPSILGCILTGIACSRGSNYIYDIFHRLRGDGNSEG